MNEKRLIKLSGRIRTYDVNTKRLQSSALDRSAPYILKKFRIKKGGTTPVIGVIQGYTGLYLHKARWD